jgi:prevent-host-death family protein
MDGMIVVSSAPGNDLIFCRRPLTAAPSSRLQLPLLQGGASYMAEKSSDSPVRIIGSRELHQNLPGILKELENNNVRYVLTVHGRPRAVLIGAEPYLSMITDGRRSSEALVGLQLTALLGGSLESVNLDDLEKALEQKVSGISS